MNDQHDFLVLFLNIQKQNAQIVVMTFLEGKCKQ
jgi:hypothetical protein